MTPQPQHEEHPDQRLDAYLDRRMSGADVKQFETDLARDPALRAALELQRAIDASLGRLLAVPSAESLRAIADDALAVNAIDATGAPSRRLPRRLSLRRVLAVAASLLLFVAGAWMIRGVTVRGPDNFAAYVPPPRQSMSAVYRETVDAGFRPEVVCRDETEFENWFVDRFDRPLRLLDELPDDVVVLGLGYGHTISESTIHLLVEVAGERVMVFVDAEELAAGFAAVLAEKASRARAPDADLHLFHREVDGLVLYEISPLPAPRVIPFAHASAAEGRTGP